MSNLETISADFSRIFGAPPEQILRAPGRVNLIGEHTDYNDGFVLPIAIDREIRIAARQRTDRRVRMVAFDLDGARSEFSLDVPIAHDPANPWGDYIRGVAWAMQARGLPLGGLNLVMRGNVPMGSGLSSSAALEVCAALTFAVIGRFEIGKVELAKLCQKAENEFVGVKSGIMDQFISALAEQDHALLIDCRDLSYQSVPMPRGISIVVCDTLKRRGLVASEYNTRRAECEQAVRLLAEPLNRPLRALRDVSPQELARSERELPATVAKRARHVITENARVLDAVSAAQRNDLAVFGALMNASHESLRDDYQVSCAELDTMVEVARKQRGCFGARLTGAGFGGCTVNLVEENAVAAFVENVGHEYQQRTRLTPEIYVCHAAGGAGIVV